MRIPLNVALFKSHEVSSNITMPIHPNGSAIVCNRYSASQRSPAETRSTGLRSCDMTFSIATRRPDQGHEILLDSDSGTEHYPHKRQRPLTFCLLSAIKSKAAELGPWQETKQRAPIETFEYHEVLPDCQKPLMYFISQPNTVIHGLSLIQSTREISVDRKPFLFCVLIHHLVPC